MLSLKGSLGWPPCHLLAYSASASIIVQIEYLLLIQKK